MNYPPGREKAGSIALVIDERLTRERRGILNRVIHVLRQFADIQLITGDPSEEELVDRLQGGQPLKLVLVPWKDYVRWNKLEAFLGIVRVSGPTVSGYSCEPVPRLGAEMPLGNLRSIFLDFSDTHPHESALLVKALMDDQKRTGLRPLLDPACRIYCETWYQPSGNGARSDMILGLAEITQTDWNARAPSIRVLLQALWSLVYEDGPGKSELGQALHGAKNPRAYLQFGADPSTLALRLWYALPGSSAKTLLSGFWPDPARPTRASQLLLAYGDFLRVHAIHERQEVEVTVGLFQSQASEKAHSQLHSLWIDPVSPSLVVEPPYEAPGPAASHLRALPAPLSSPALDAKLRTAAGEAKVRELMSLLDERDQLIRDLRSGGVGTSHPLPPPDAEGLLEAFQERYAEARLEISRFELRIAGMAKAGASTAEIEAIRLQMEQLAARERGWIQSLAQALESSPVTSSKAPEEEAASKMLRSKKIGDYEALLLSEIEADIPLPADVHLYFKANRHILVWRKSGERVSQATVEKYLDRGLKSVWIHRDDLTRWQKRMEPVGPARTKEGLRLRQVLASKTLDDLRKRALTAQTARALLADTAAARTPESQAEALSHARDAVFDLLESLQVLTLAAKKSRDAVLEMWNLGTQDAALAHGLNVSAFAVLFSLAFGRLHPEVIYDLALAGLLHDSGLTQLPAPLAWIPRNQQQAETARRYERHVDEGLRILGSFAPELPPRIRTMIAQHHEKFNGTGYPQQLSGFRVNDIAQLLGMADAVDSMASGQWDGKTRLIHDTFLELERLEKSRSHPEFFNPDVFASVLRWIHAPAARASGQKAAEIVRTAVKAA